MVDFAALPPEVNSGRMYEGSGARPLLAAAAGWDGVASELGSAAGAYQSVVSDLTTGEWRGPAASAMAAAAGPYVSWMNATASAAKQTAGQARSAAAAYEEAFSAMVPPPVITANRSTLASLVATNIVGQNTAAIAANEANYAEMWAQDAAAMYGYAGASAAATQLTAYSPAPETTNPAGSAAQAGATSQASSTNGLSQAISQVPTALQAMATPAATDPFASIEDFLSDPLIQAAGTLIGTLGNYYGYAFSAVGFVGCLPGFFIGPLLSLALPEAGALPAAFAATASGVSEGALGAGLADSYVSGVGGGVSAGLGEAASVGGLSVPPTWGGPVSSPAVRLAASEIPLAGLNGVPESAPVAPSGLMGGVPPMGSVVNAPREGQSRLRAGHRAKVIPAIAAAPGAHPDTPQKWSQPSIASAHSDAALSDQEQAELDELREQLSELAMERDAAARLVKEAIR